MQAGKSDDMNEAFNKQTDQANDPRLADFAHRALLVCINRTVQEVSIYDAARYAWRLSLDRANQVEVVLAVEHGIILGAFIPEKWLEATPINFPDQPEMPGRLGFVGSKAPAQIRNRYVGQRVPEEFRFGSGNPIRYTWK